MFGWFSAASVCASRVKRHSIGVTRKSVRDDLQRDLAIQLGIAGAIDLPHTAHAEQRDDFIRAEASAGSERRGRQSCREFSVNRAERRDYS